MALSIKSLSSDPIPMGLTSQKLQDIFNLIPQANVQQLEKIIEDIKDRLRRLSKTGK